MKNGKNIIIVVLLIAKASMAVAHTEKSNSHEGLTTTYSDQEPHILQSKLEIVKNYEASDCNLLPYPELKDGERTPFNLWKYGGKVKCISSHRSPVYVNDYMHDIQVERFYKGMPEGFIKPFPLRGVKDSLPYLHNGKCNTLHDAIEFFDLILELKLSKEEKETFVAQLL